MRTSLLFTDRNFSIINTIQFLFIVFSVSFTQGQTFCEDILGSDCNNCPDYKVFTNPDLMVSCESSINAILLIDESNSIGNSNAEQDVQDGVSAFLQELECSDVNVAIIEFGSAANYIVPTYTPVSSVIEGMNNYFNGIPYNNQTYNPNQGVFGATNWQAGFLQANALPPADLLLMLTDGVPTAFTPDANLPASSFDFCGSGNSTQEAELYNAVQVANEIKSEGTHIFILGVGTVSGDLLANISDDDIYGEGQTIATADYFIDQGFGTLSECFASLANSLCPIVDNIQGSTICEGDNNGIISISISGDATAPFYIAINGNEPIVTNNYNELITDLEVGSYTVHIEGSGSCFGTGDFTVEVLAYPLPDLLVENSTVCQGKKNGVNLTSLVTSNGNITFHNTFEDAENGINSIINTQVNPSNETIYYIRSESLENDCYLIDSITVFVDIPPTCSADNALINCYSENGVVELNVITNAENASYEWTSFAGNIVSGAFTANPIVNQSGIYIVEVTDLETGCTNTCSVTVTEDLMPPEVFIDSIDTLCSRHEPLQLSAFPIGGEFSGDFVSSSGIFEAYDAGIYTITYQYTNPENGCEGIATLDIEVVDCCSDETTFAYNQELATCFPGVRIDTNGNLLSQGSNTLNRSSRWGWSNGALDFNTDYTFQLIAGAGRCRVSNGELVGEVTISYNEVGDMLINYGLNEQNNNMYYQLGSIHVYIGCNQFPESLAPGQMPYGTSADDELSAQLLIPAEDLEALSCEQYYFIAHAEVNVCSTEMTMNRIINNNKQTTLVSNNINFKVYPVPFKDVVTIEYSFDYVTQVEIEIVDIHGRIIYSYLDTNYHKGLHSISKVNLNVTNQQLLFVRVSTSNGTIIKKIIAE